MDLYCDEGSCTICDKDRELDQAWFDAQASGWASDGDWNVSMKVEVKKVPTESPEW